MQTSELFKKKQPFRLGRKAKVTFNLWGVKNKGRFRCRPVNIRMFTLLYFHYCGRLSSEPTSPNATFFKVFGLGRASNPRSSKITFSLQTGEHLHIMCKKSKLFGQNAEPKWPWNSWWLQKINVFTADQCTFSHLDYEATKNCFFAADR